MGFFRGCNKRMHRPFVLLFLTLALGGALALTTKNLLQESSFREFVRRSGRVYSSEEARKQAFATFQSNLDTVARLRKVNPHATFELHEHNFDNTPQFPLAKIHAAAAVGGTTSCKLSKPAPSQFSVFGTSYVTPVGNEGQCGSTWAFAAVGTIETAYAFGKQTTAVPLSVGQVAECDTQSSGCNGGYPAYALDYVMKAGGLETAATYPYDSTMPSCRVPPLNCTGGCARLLSYCGDELINDEQKMMQALAQYGALSINVDASNFMFYTGGVFQSGCDPANVNHCLQVVGYGTTDSGIPFWRCKNQWGANWGVAGYIDIYRGNNTCGISTGPLAVTGVQMYYS